MEHRRTPDHRTPSDAEALFDAKELAAAGWTRQNVTCEPRLSEAAETYRELGLEVLLVPLVRERRAGGEGASCTACFRADSDADRFKVIYTRPGTKAAAGGVHHDPAEGDSP